MIRNRHVEKEMNRAYGTALLTRRFCNVYPEFKTLHCRPSTGNLTLSFSLTYVLVVRAGVEPATHGFSVHCSTN
jgi:hypothetical protein